MNNSRVGSYRWFFIGTALLALILLVVSVTVSGSQPNNDIYDGNYNGTYDNYGTNYNNTTNGTMYDNNGLNNGTTTNGTMYDNNGTTTNGTMYDNNGNTMNGTNYNTTTNGTMYDTTNVPNTINNVKLDYPRVQNLSNKKVQNDVNASFISEKDAFSKLAQEGKLAKLDYQISYKGDDFLSVVFNAILRKNNKEVEEIKAKTYNMQTGKELKYKDLIPNSVYTNSDFIRLVSDKANMLGMQEVVVLNDKTGVYLNRTNRGKEYVFFFKRAGRELYNKINLSEAEINQAMQGVKNDKLIKLDRPNKPLITEKMVILGQLFDLVTQNLYIKNEHIMVPVELIARQLSFTLKRNDNDTRLEISKGPNRFTIIEDEHTFYTGTTPVKLGVITEKTSNKFFVPIEFITEILKYHVTIKENMIYITESNNMLQNEGI